MIFGVGTDIIEIYRIKKIVEENKLFLEKYFTEKENKYFKSKKLRPETIAGNFAAKEAIAKAFKTGFSKFELCDIEVLRDDLGCPIVNFYNYAKVLKEKLNIKNIQVSISHCNNYATAYAIMEY